MRNHRKNDDEVLKIQKEKNLIQAKYFTLLENLRESIAIYKAIDDGSYFRERHGLGALMAEGDL